MAHSLFKDVAIPNKKIHRRPQARFIKDSPQIVQLHFELNDGCHVASKVLQSARPNEELAVELDKDIITAVIEFLQQGGWDASLVRKRRKPRRDNKEDEAISGCTTSSADEVCKDKANTATTLGSAGGWYSADST